MKKLLCILLPALLGLSGCGVLRCPKPELQVRDSLVLHIKDSLAIRYIPVEVPVPVEVMREIIPSSDSSHLETSVARSDAFIDSTGHLHHTLENKAGSSLHVDVPMEEHFHTEEVEQLKQEVKTVTVEVERELTWQQKLWITSGKLFWVLLLGAIVIIIGKKICLS